MRETPRPALRAVFDRVVRPDDIGPGSLAALLAAAYREDLDGGGDITTASIVPGDREATAHIVTRAAGIIAGLPVIEHVLATFGFAVTAQLELADGAACARNTRVGTLAGPLAEIVAAERTLLNLLGHLSGVATLTRRFVDAVTRGAGKPVLICATRKTLPGLRSLEKYAVVCGGGEQHRLGLYDAALYKDNHLAHLDPAELPAQLAAAIRSVRAQHDVSFVEVEVDTIMQAEAVLALPVGLVDLLLLDNMTIADLAEVVALRAKRAPAVGLEASGGVTLDTVRAIAETGVDRISVGALTHSAPALDIGLDIGLDDAS